MVILIYILEQRLKLFIKQTMNSITRGLIRLKAQIASLVNYLYFFQNSTKFNLQCLLDLIEEKDQNDFKLLVKQLESELDYSESKNETLA